MSETKAKEQKVSKSIAQEASDDQAYQTDMHYARKGKKMNLEKGFSRVRTITGIVAKEQESKGNHQTAKLIASAPDMLEFLHRLDYEMYYNPDTKHWKTEIFELINKAEGK